MPDGISGGAPFTTANRNHVPARRKQANDIQPPARVSRPLQSQTSVRVNDQGAVLLPAGRSRLNM